MRAVASLKIYTLMFFLWIAYKVSAKKSAEELPLMTLRSDPKFEEKLNFCLKNDMRNLMNFNASSGKSGNFYFDGLLLSKVCNVWAKEIQTIYVVKNDLWFQKRYKKFGEFSQK